MSDRQGRSFAVIGLGAFGATVATELARFGNRVLGIDAKEPNVVRIADQLYECVIADGRDEQALRQIGVGAYDVAIVAIGEELEANLLCTMNLRLLGVETIWVKAVNKTHHRILAKLGADRVILPEQEIGRHIAQMLHNPLMRDYVSLGNGYHVVDYRAPGSLDGARLSDLNLRDRHELRMLGLMREGEFISAEIGDPVLKEGDKMLLLGRRETLRRFGDGL